MTDRLGGQDSEMTRPKTRNLANGAVWNARLAPSPGHQLRCAAKQQSRNATPSHVKQAEPTHPWLTSSRCANFAQGGVAHRSITDRNRSRRLPLTKTETQACEKGHSILGLAPLLPDRDVTPIGILAQCTDSGEGSQPSQPLRSSATCPTRQHRRQLVFPDTRANQPPPPPALHCSVIVRQVASQVTMPVRTPRCSPCAR